MIKFDNTAIAKTFYDVLVKRGVAFSLRKIQGNWVFFRKYPYVKQADHVPIS